MQKQLFTVVWEYRDYTGRSQMFANDQREAVALWAFLFSHKRWVPLVSTYIARDVLRQLEDAAEPHALMDLHEVWELIGFVGGDCYVTTIVGANVAAAGESLPRSDVFAPELSQAPYVRNRRASRGRTKSM